MIPLNQSDLSDGSNQSSNIVETLLCASHKWYLHVESFWAAPDPQMALALSCPLYTLFWGNPIKIQAVITFTLSTCFTLSIVSLQNNKIPHVLIQMPFFLFRFCWLLRHNCAVRIDNIVLCQLFLILIIIFIVTLILIIIPIIDRLSRSPSGRRQMLWWFICSLTSVQNNWSVTEQWKASYGSASGSYYSDSDSKRKRPAGANISIPLKTERPSWYFRPPSCHLTCVTRPHHSLLCFVPFSTEILLVSRPLTPG